MTLRERFQPPEGRALAPYEGLACIGHGPIAGVYRAWDAARGRWVALKVLRSELARRGDLEACLRQAVALTPPARYPHILPVLDAGHCDAACYVVLPHVAGDLQTQRPASIVQVLRLLYRVCQALDHAHHGAPPLVHHRLKSTNVLLTGPGRAVVADLALAEALEVDLAGLAQLGLLGPLTYTAPRRPLPRGPRLVAAPPCSTPPCRRLSRRPLVAAWR